MIASYPDTLPNVNTVTSPNTVDWSSLSASCVSFCRWVNRWYHQTGDVSASTAYLARKQGKNKRTVYRWLEAAEAAGALSRVVVQGVERSIIPLAEPPSAGRRKPSKCHRLCHRSYGQNVTGPTCNDAYTQGTQHAECVALSGCSDSWESEGFPQSQSAITENVEQVVPATEQLGRSITENPCRPLPGKTGGGIPKADCGDACASVGGVGGPTETLKNTNGEVSNVCKPGDMRKIVREYPCFDGSKRSAKTLKTGVTKRCLPLSTGKNEKTQCREPIVKVSPSSDLSESARALANTLCQMGVSEPVAKTLAIDHRESVLLQLAALPFRSARDKAALLVASVRESWPIPSTFLESQAKEKKRLADAQNCAMRAELSKRRETARNGASVAFSGLSDAVRADLLARAELDLRTSMPGAWQIFQKRPESVRASWVRDRAISLMEGGQKA